MIKHRGLLATLGLSPERLARRKLGIGGSDARKILSGNPEDVLALWQEKRGEREADDLSRNLPVQLGSYTEPLNAAWYEMNTGREIWACGEERRSPAFDWMYVTLDGLTTTEDGEEAVWEAKHVNAFSKMDEVVQRYMPQLHHAMHCTQLNRALLCVFKGTTEQHIIDVRRDDWYLAQLIEAERDFWDCVVTGRPPVAVDPTAATEAIEAIRIVDMAGSNSWADAAASWIETRPSAALFERSAKDLKGLIPDDAKVAFGNGVRITRRKNNSLVIEPDKENS